MLEHLSQLSVTVTVLGRGRGFQVDINRETKTGADRCSAVGSECKGNGHEPKPVGNLWTLDKAKNMVSSRSL